MYTIYIFFTMCVSLYVLHKFEDKNQLHVLLKLFLLDNQLLPL